MRAYCTYTPFRKERKRERKKERKDVPESVLVIIESLGRRLEVVQLAIPGRTCRDGCRNWTPRDRFDASAALHLQRTYAPRVHRLDAAESERNGTAHCTYLQQVGGHTQHACMRLGASTWQVRAMNRRLGPATSLGSRRRTCPPDTRRRASKGLLPRARLFSGVHATDKKEAFLPCRRDATRSRTPRPAARLTRRSRSNGR